MQLAQRCAVPMIAILVLAACGARETMASRSAAAYRDAQAKGVTVSGGHEHGEDALPHTQGPAGTSTTGNHAGMDHSSTASAHHDGVHAAQATDHAAMDHGTMDHGTMDHRTMDHAAMSPSDHVMSGGAGAHSSHEMPAGTSHAAMHDATAHGSVNSAAAHPGMTHGGASQSTAASAHSGHAMAQAPANPHAGHGASGASTALPAPGPVSAPLSNGEIAGLRPATTLRPDDFDVPASASVAEAARAASGAHSMHMRKEN